MANRISFNGRLTLAFNVKDRRAAARWWAEALGFDLLYDAEEMGWCEITTAVPGVTIGLSDQHDGNLGGPVPTFEVADLDQARAALERRGVRFEGPTVVHEGAVKLATFTDLEGNRCMLAESLQEA